MYTYLYSTVDCNVPFAWFQATGRSIYEVATMFQRGNINQEFIKEYISHNGTEFLVAFTNFREYKFEPGCKYQLKTALSNTPGYIKLYIVTPDGEYFAKFFRHPVDPINEATWVQLMPKTYIIKSRQNENFIPSLLSEEDEFKDLNPHRSILVKSETADDIADTLAELDIVDTDISTDDTNNNQPMEWEEDA